MAQLAAADFLPPVWLVRQRTRIKTQAQATHVILARNLAPTAPVSDLFGKVGRHWLSTRPLPAGEQSSARALVPTKHGLRPAKTMIRCKEARPPSQSTGGVHPVYNPGSMVGVLICLILLCAVLAAVIILTLRNVGIVIMVLMRPASSAVSQF